jgi:hypothetical protein
MKEKILALLKALGVVKDEDLAKVTTELDKLELEKPINPPIDTSKIQNEDIKKLIEGFQAQINSVMAVNKNLADALAAEKKAREEAIAAQTATAKTEKDKKIADAVDAAIKEGKFPEAKREHLKKMFEADFDSFAEVVKDTPVNKHFQTSEKKKEGENNNNNNNEPIIKSALDTGGGLFTKVKEFAGLNNEN